MRVCVVVLNSIWFDPRVRKQLISYNDNNFDVVCVGYKCKKFDAQKVSDIPCDCTVVDRDPRFPGKQRSPINKLRREWSKDKNLCDAIVAYKPDIIHANDLDTLAACVKAAHILKCPVVYDSHEINVENHHLKKFQKIYAGLLEKRYIKKVDHMVCVSHAAADYFAKKYKIPLPMVVTNCSLLSEQAVCDKKHEGFEILNHGQYYGGRGYDIMIEALPYLKDYPEIKLALRGFGKMEESLRERASVLDDERVFFYPPVMVKELIGEAAKSHVGVAITEPICLNFKLSVSNKLFEYATAGLPVIMSDIPEHRYLNDKHDFGIIIPDNSPETFAHAVINLYTDKDLYNKCAENARKLSIEICWDKEFSKLIDVERRLIDQHT